MPESGGYVYAIGIDGTTLVKIGRAAVLARYDAEGVTQAQLAEWAGVKQTYVSRLLLYHRFNMTVSHIKIPEFRFRQYWKQMATFKHLKNGRTEG
jgi:hypothetical protein